MMAWVATHGALGLVGVMLFERLVPIVPAHGLLVAIGVGCAQGLWSLPQAVALSSASSLTGALLIYAAGTLVGTARSTRALHWVSRLLRVPPEKLDGLLARCRAREVHFAFSSQLIPVVRELAPAMAGLLKVDPLMFLRGTAPGILVWNGLFITAGYLAAVWSGTSNASGVALIMLVALLGLESAGFAVWRCIARARKLARA
jgi:membrane protein DedA with SNARE-associated domain